MPSYSADGTETLEPSSMTSQPPPSLPLDRVYTANYCEENIYLIAKRFLDDADVRSNWSVYAVFISNKTRSVALWSQKLREDVVVWDYHVILALKPRVSRTSPGRQIQYSATSDGSLEESATASGSVPIGKGLSWIYDLDSQLAAPCRWEEYISSTFPYSTKEAVEVGWIIPETYQSLFRIVEGEEFLESFASDRSHMLVPASDPPRYHSPEPPYPPIRGAKAASLGIKNNLMSHFVCMDVENTDIGRVHTLEQAKDFFDSNL